MASDGDLQKVLGEIKLSQSPYFDPSTRLTVTTANELEAMIADGSVDGGMIPKVASCVRAVRRGVGHAHILDGRQPHALLLEIFTHEGIGPMVSA